MGGRALVLFGFGSVWLRDLDMQLCFGFASDVFGKLHIYLIIEFDFISKNILSPREKGAL